LQKKEKDLIFKANFIYIFFYIFVSFLLLYFWESNLYSRFLILNFGICYQFCTFKNPIFSTNFYLGVWLLAWLPSTPFDFPFSPSGHLYLLPPPSLLYPIVWISLGILGFGEHLGNWLLARSISLFLTSPFSSWSPLSPSSVFFSLCNSVNLSGCSRRWRAHRELITG